VHTENLVIAVNPKVVVISRHEHLLGRAVEYLSADKREWAILRVSESEALEDLVQKVEEANPDIVIVSQDELGHDERLLARLNQDCPDVKKVILVSLSENLMEVYSKQKIQVKSVQDLFSEVESQLSKF
jgi:DNA-binding NarL/FixJ family response regulator